MFMKPNIQLINGGNTLLILRSVFEQRHMENGKLVKYTLDQAAEIVGVSRKTLEDYYYCLKKAQKISIVWHYFLVDLD